MSQTIASEMVQKGFDVVSEEILRSKILSTEKMHDVLFGCQLGGNFIESLWQLLQGALDRGMEKRRLVEFARNYLGNLDRGTELFNKVKERVTGSSLSAEERSRANLILEELIRRFLEIRKSLVRIQQWLERPRPMVALSSLPDKKGWPDYEEYTDLEDFEKRLLSHDDK